MDDDKTLLNFDDDLMALAGIAAPAPGLHSDSEIPAAPNNDDIKSLLDSLKIEKPGKKSSELNSAIKSKVEKNDAAPSGDATTNAGNDTAVSPKVSPSDSALPANKKSGSTEANRAAKSKRLSDNNTAIKAGIALLEEINGISKTRTSPDATPIADLFNEAANKSAENDAVLKSSSQEESSNDADIIDDIIAESENDAAPLENQKVENPAPDAELIPPTASSQRTRLDAIIKAKTSADANAKASTKESNTPKDDPELKDEDDENTDDENAEAAVPPKSAVEDENDELKEAFEPQLQMRHNFQEIVKAQGRSFSHTLLSLANPKQRSGALFLTVIAMLIAVTLLVVLTHYKHREIQLGYALSNAISEREALLEENRRLRIELRVLTTRDRLETIADKQLGLTKPRPEQIIFINRSPHLPAPAAPAPARRNDGLDKVKVLEN